MVTYVSRVFIGLFTSSDCTTSNDTRSPLLPKCHDRLRNPVWHFWAWDDNFISSYRPRVLRLYNAKRKPPWPWTSSSHGTICSSHTGLHSYRPVTCSWSDKELSVRGHCPPLTPTPLSSMPYKGKKLTSTQLKCKNGLVANATGKISPLQQMRYHYKFYYTTYFI